MPKIDAQIEAQAAAFESFMRRAQEVKVDFAGPTAVRQALQTGAAYNSDQFGEGMVAYAALAALREPGFVAAVNNAARDKRSAQALATRLSSRPDLVMQLPRADAAAGRARTALQARAVAVSRHGAAAKKAAYDVQRQSWSRSRVPDPQVRLAEVKRISAATYHPTSEDMAALYRTLSDVSRPTASGARSSPIVVRGVALAALALLGQPAKARAAMSEPKGRWCLKMAKLNLYQCLASAGPYYEDVFCLGQHALTETGQCVAEAAGPPQRAASRSSPAA